MTVELKVLEDPAGACADLIAAVASDDGSIVLAGGSTPQAAYIRAARIVADWAGVTLWFGDERCVPPDDERSNFAMVKRSLLDAIGADQQPVVRRIAGELGPFEAADAYDAELRGAVSSRFELVILGLGPDGHTASLFPDQNSLAERSRLAVGVEQAGLEPFVPRVTLTLAAIASAARVVFLVSGAGKADAVSAVFGPDSEPDPHVPASLLAPLASNITVLLDGAAAGGLE